MWNASLDVKKKTRAGNKVHSGNFRFTSKIEDFSVKNTYSIVFTHRVFPRKIDTSIMNAAAHHQIYSIETGGIARY
jgi:hypothetical protein